MIARSLAPVLGLALLAGSACNSRNKYDVYMEGLAIEAAAEKGPCKLKLEQGQAMPTLSGDQVQTCLARTEDAIELYEEARELGMNDIDHQRVLARAYERRDNLKDMLKNVRAMERGAM